VLVIAAVIGYTNTLAPSAHANANLWLIGWVDNDQWQANQTYRLTVPWADLQSSTVTVTVSWGDQTSDRLTSIGALDNNFRPPAYSASPELDHVYTKAGVLTYTITLADPLGNSYMKTLTITITPHNGLFSEYATGGKAPVKK
jgi:hypothetical protein